MASYTIELRNIVKTYGMETVKEWFMDYDLSDYLTEEEIAVITARGVWDKEKLAERIINHYAMREIGFETPSYFAMKAKVLMSEIMEEKAPLIYSASIKYDPLVNVDFVETYDEDSTGKSNSSSSNNGSGVNINSDTPQGKISKSAILNGEYASATSASESNNTTDDSTNTEGKQHYVKTTKGNSGVSATAQALIKQYRDVIRAVNTEIVYQLEPLFMGIY